MPDKMIVCRHNKKHQTLLSRPQPRIYTQSVCLSVLMHLCNCLPVCLALLCRGRDAVVVDAQQQTNGERKAGETGLWFELSF